MQKKMLKIKSWDSQGNYKDQRMVGLESSHDKSISPTLFQKNSFNDILFCNIEFKSDKF